MEALCHCREQRTASQSLCCGVTSSPMDTPSSDTTNPQLCNECCHSGNTTTQALQNWEALFKGISAFCRCALRLPSRCCGTRPQLIGEREGTRRRISFCEGLKMKRGGRRSAVRGGSSEPSGDQGCTKVSHRVAAMYLANHQVGDYILFT